MKQDAQKNKKRQQSEPTKSSYQRIQDYFSSSTHSTSSSHSMVCDNDQCSIRPNPVSVTPSTEANVPSMTLDPMRTQWETETSCNSFNPKETLQCSLNPNSNVTISDTTQENVNTEDAAEEVIIQPELTEALIQAIKVGSISCFVLTPILDRLSDYLKNKQYTSSQIMMITQAIRGLAIISLGTSPQIAISLPVVNFLLTEYAKVSPLKANILTAGSLLLGRVCMNPLGAGVTLATTAFAFGFNYAGNKIMRRNAEESKSATPTYHLQRAAI